MRDLDAPTHDYAEGGAGDEVTLRENEVAWRALRFRPPVLVGAGTASTAVSLLGTDLAAPVGIAPTALHHVAHPDAEAATAAGAARARSLLVLSSRASVPIERVAEVEGCRWWFQVYAMRDRGLTLDLAVRAAACGARALVLTGDTPVVAAKRRATPDLEVVPTHLALLRRHTGRDLAAEDVRQDPTAGLDLVGALAAATGLPVLVKGVLRSDDARRCLDAGAAGVVVSNHGGRQLDRAVPTAHALEEVVDAVAGAAPVLVDGGLRSGRDVLAALAMGARAALIGRPVLRALAAEGAEGVAALLDRFRAEVQEALTLVGAPDPASVRRDLLVGGSPRRGDPARRPFTIT